MAIASISPATGKTIRTFTAHTPAEVEERLERAAGAFRLQRQTSFEVRAQMMIRAADLLEAEKDRLASLMTLEMGKPISAARAEAVKCAWVCRYYAATAAQHLADEVIETNAARSYVSYEPLGAILAIMPWNFPFWQVFRFAAPALMAGNVGLLKHSSNVPQCALAIEEIFARAGFPEGAFQTLLIEAARVEPLLADARIVAATLTGSEPAGREIAAAAGRQIKKTVLELGGSDPFVVMPSADLETAVKTAVAARTINNGQSCIASKRFIISDLIAHEFTERFVRAMSALRVGDPMDEATELGPLATPGILEELDEQVRRSVALGARVLTGGRRLDRPGNYYPATVLTDIPEGAPAGCEELFGPVAALFRVSSIDEAIRFANATGFGLAASVWTRDESERARLVAEIEAGQVFVNAMVASDPRLPFGGIKRSGYGRELSVQGIREFVNIKTIWIN